MVICEGCKNFGQYIPNRNEPMENYSDWCELKNYEEDPLVNGDRYFNDQHDCSDFKPVPCYKSECVKNSIGIMVITYRGGDIKRLPICKTHELINKAYVETTITDIEMEYYEENN